MPKPIVTADVAIGSIRAVSSSLPRDVAAAIASAARAPTATAITTATSMTRTEVTSESNGSMPMAIPGRTSARPRVRQARNE